MTLIVPFAPGGGSDLASRLVANELSKALGQRIVIENKGGAGGNIGFAAGAKAPPDGYTLTTITQNITVNPHLTKDMPLDPLKDLQPIGVMVQVY
ncbi:MAG: tripartite tricarboxylate transporter substrate binding protein, partial [Betaproteobacteria bacterium]|nr:tripartite tricarboxylate transporter substrate binding protein [Betaproteobacteria bacterium]